MILESEVFTLESHPEIVGWDSKAGMAKASREKKRVLLVERGRGPGGLGTSGTGVTAMARWLCWTRFSAPKLVLVGTCNMRESEEVLTKSFYMKNISQY